MPVFVFKKVLDGEKKTKKNIHTTTLKTVSLLLPLIQEQFFNSLTTFHYFVEIVTATGVHNQHTYSEKLPARGIIRRNLGTETLGRILDVRLRSLQNFCEF